jgi:hypothetical protein
MENKITYKEEEDMQVQMEVESFDNKPKDENSSISIDDISNECQSQLNELMEQQKKNKSILKGQKNLSKEWRP